MRGATRGGSAARRAPRRRAPGGACRSPAARPRPRRPAPARRPSPIRPGLARARRARRPDSGPDARGHAGAHRQRHADRGPDSLTGSRGSFATAGGWPGRTPRTRAPPRSRPGCSCRWGTGARRPRGGRSGTARRPGRVPVAGQRNEVECGAVVTPKSFSSSPSARACASRIGPIVGSDSSATGSIGSSVSGGGPVCSRIFPSTLPIVEYIGMWRGGADTSGQPAAGDGGRGESSSARRPAARSCPSRWRSRTRRRGACRSAASRRRSVTIASVKPTSSAGHGAGAGG